MNKPMSLQRGSSLGVNMGTLVIESMPAAIKQSIEPDITTCVAKCNACCDDPLCRSTEVPAPTRAKTRRESRVAGLLADLADAAQDHVGDGPRVRTGALDQRVHDLNGQRRYAMRRR